MVKKTSTNEMLRKVKAIDGLAILIEEELENFDENTSIKEVGRRREKISNLILYAKQVGYCGNEYSKIEELERTYEDRLSEFKKVFNWW